MKNLSILILSVLLLVSCNQNKVTVYGKVKGLKNGEILLLKQVPGQDELVEVGRTICEKEDFKVSTEDIVIPARLWVEFPNGYRVPCLVDTKDKTFVKAVKGHYDQAEVYGSGLINQYNDVKKLFEEKYVEPMVDINKAVKKIKAKEKMTKDHKVMLGIYELRLERYKKYRADYAIKLIENNRSQDLSLFIMYDELKDSVELKKKLFPKLIVENKNSNIYKLLEYDVNN